MKQWTRPELIIALEFYVQCDTRMHTDAHPKCKQIAALIGRTPGGLDGILRNVRYEYTDGEAGWPNASVRVKKLVAEFKDNKAGLMKEAAKIRAENGWQPLNCSE